ncbi:uncharacterized protein LOC135366778 isoform X2 [Ornithodoros turicata]|uniref:uncharacterized protein LOC135366778 isoform X2 n=1 Tax=Ornithodoros turicata TaxID=34597 RepID=UPI003139230D
MLRNIWCVEALCGAVVLVVCARAATLEDDANQGRWMTQDFSAQTGYHNYGDSQRLSKLQHSPLHLIRHNKTFSEAKSYCSKICKGCKILHRAMLQSSEMWLKLTDAQYWLYDDDDEDDQHPLPFCTLFFYRNEVPFISPRSCSSKHNFICVLPKQGSPCSLSLVVFPPDTYPRPKPRGCSRLLDVHKSQERQCAEMHMDLSFGWWTYSGGSTLAPASNYYHGPPGSLCNAATLSLAAGYLITPWNCDVLFPFMCVPPISDNTPEEPLDTPSSVKCYYFGDSPIGTYCQVMDPTGASSALQAQRRCEALNMTLLNISDVTLHRLCLLMDRNHFNNTRIWIAGISENSRGLPDCGLELLNVSVVQNGAAPCDTCAIHVVCDAGFYQTSSTCVTLNDARGPMEYCYYNKPEYMHVSEGLCKTVGKSLLNEASVDDLRINEHLYTITNSHVEYWVELDYVAEGSLSAVVAYEPYSSVLSMPPCTTVWMGRRVPWIFQRDCSDRLPIICQAKKQSVTPYPDRHTDACRYRRNTSGTVFCVPTSGRYNITEAMEFCYKRNMTVLLGSSLKDLRNFNGPGDLGNVPKGNMWFTDGSSYRKCKVVSLADHSKGDRNCYERNSYICMGRPQERVQSCHQCRQTNCSFCVGGASLGNPESQKSCKRHSLSLLPVGRDTDYYLEAFSVLTHGYSEITEVWLHSLGRSADQGCISMYMHNGTFYERLLNCSIRLQFICTPSTPTVDSSIKHCDAEKVNGIWWPITEKDHVAEANCTSDPGSPLAYRKCDVSGSWEAFVDTSECTSAVFNQFLEKVQSVNNTEAIGDILKNASSQVAFGGDLAILASGTKNALELVDKLLANMTPDEQSNATQTLAGNMVLVTSNAMRHQGPWHGLPKERRLDTATEYMDNVETTIHKMLRYNGDVKNFELSHGGITVEVVKEEGKSPVHLPKRPTGTSLYLPSDFTAEEMVDVIYAEYSSLATLLHDQQQKNSRDKTKETYVGTPVVTVTVLNSAQSPLSGLRGDVKLTFKNLVGKDWHDLTAQCAYIAFQNGSRWETSGCSLFTSTASEVVCTCNHLTNFAVLMSNNGGQTTEELEWITNIGCGISIVCLALCIIVFTAFRQLRGIRNTIHRNLCISLLLAEVLMIAVMDQRRGLMKIIGDGISKNNTVCTVIACALHFLFLSAFCWMALEGCHIIVLLWKVFNSKRTYYERYYFVGYGIPLLIVSITFGVGHDSYTNKSDQDYLCWIPKEHNLRLSFIVPVLLVIALNIGTLCLVLWKMARLRQAADKSTAEKVRNWVRGTFILLPLLGVTWLLGLALWEDTVGVAAYAFTILNSLQGVGIFVCHVLMSKKARDVVLNSLNKTTMKLTKGSQMSRSSRSSANTTWYRLSTSAGSSPQSSAVVDSVQKTGSGPVCDSDLDSSTCNDCWTPSKFKFQMNLNSDKDVNATTGSSTQVGKPDGLFFRRTTTDC